MGGECRESRLNSGSLVYAGVYALYLFRAHGLYPFLFAREEGEEQAGRRQGEAEGREHGCEACEARLGHVRQRRRVLFKRLPVSTTPELRSSEGSSFQHIP